MKMEYKLLNSNNGVIMTRAPELIGDMLYISFTGAPDKATAIFERSDGESAYRALSDGLCGIESDWLDGSIKVTVAVLNGSVRAQRWFCEGFCAMRIKECRGVLIYPDDMDMQKKIAAKNGVNIVVGAKIAEIVGDGKVEGVMLADTMTPDGIYVNASGERTAYIPGWVQDNGRWRYVMKNGYYAANRWFQDTDGKWYHFDMAAYMEADKVTVDGYYVDANGVWDGQPSTATSTGPSIGPAGDLQSSEGWEQVAQGWKYRQTDGSYVTNSWFQAPDGKWYYFGTDAVMLADTTTPDGYYVDASGAWME